MRIKKFNYTLLLFISIFLLISCTGDEIQHEEISIIPRPLEVERLEGYFTLNQKTKLILKTDSDEAKELTENLAKKLRTSTGLPIRRIEMPDSADYINSIILSIEYYGILNSTEEYSLIVNQNSIEISAGSGAGLFYGIQSLYQIFPPEIESGKVIKNIKWNVPCVRINDKPRFRWRGVHLDVGRHFFSKEFIKNYIDFLALYKMNTFHWHLTEDQGWRIEIKKYPKLTQIGSVRKESMGDGKQHGGFYTQNDIREIVKYAEERFVEIVPEIEMPGHSLAALASYPELSCTWGPFEVGTIWGVYEDVYCAGNEKTFEFLENVLSEVITLFPGKFIHIGGDECPKERWKKCKKCQRRIKKEKLKDEHELQSYFIKKIEKFLNSKGKQIIGWDEILEGGLAPNAAVMSWRGIEGGIEAAKSRHDVVMTPTSYCYFDYYQAKGGEPKAIGGFLPLEKVYSFEPVPVQLTRREAKYIMGAQANMWTEYMTDSKHVEYMLFPRLCALSEVVWSGTQQRDYEDFLKRMPRHYERFNILNINYRKPDEAPTSEVADREIVENDIPLSGMIMQREKTLNIYERSKVKREYYYSSKVKVGICFFQKLFYR